MYIIDALAVLFGSLKKDRISAGVIT